jgi:hypothetical protein
VFKNKKNIIIIGVVICVAIIVFLFWDNIKEIFSKKDTAEAPINVNTNTGNNTNTNTNNSNQNTSNTKNVVAVGANVGLFPRNSNTTVLKLFQNNQIIGKYDGVDGSFFLVDWDGVKGKVLVSKSKLQ